MATDPDSPDTAHAVLVAKPVETEAPDDNREFLEAVAAAVRVRRLAEVAELEAAAEWVTRHGHPLPVRSGRQDPMLTPGGDGTPSVREYAVPELAMVRGEHTARTRSMIADVLDLQHLILTAPPGLDIYVDGQITLSPDYRG